MVGALLSLRWPPRIAVAFCGLVGVLLPAAYGLLSGIPEPVIHDEFSYLLGADTFVRGSLTNPAPPLPEFFEAPHVIVSPTYQSKYPPAQALLLAVGQGLMGHPIWGVWFSCGLFAAAACWMLQAWTARHWAPSVTLICAATLGTTTYWAQSYWGGMLPACGGALVMGAVRRTLRRPRVLTSSIMAIGLLVLASTRPYEGALLSVPAALLLGRWLVRDATYDIKRKVMRVVVPVAVILVVGAGVMMNYNRAVTGEFRRTPYDLHLRQYFQRGVFVFSTPRAPERTPVARIAGFYDEAESDVAQKRSRLLAVLGHFAVRMPMSLIAPFGLASAASIEAPPYRGVTIWLVLLFAVWKPRSPRAIGLALAGALAAESLLWLYLPVYPWPLVPIVIAAWLMAFRRTATRDAWARFVFVTLLFCAAGGALVWWWFPHYSAPATCLVLAVIASSLQRLSRRLPAGTAPRLVPLVTILLAAHIPMVYALRTDHRHSGGSLAGVGFRTRGDIVRQLEALPGNDLVFVEYDEQFSKHIEFVYNGADLASSPVIFAHRLGDERNAALMDVYRERLPWILRVSVSEFSLTPYDPASKQPRPNSTLPSQSEQ